MEGGGRGKKEFSPPFRKKVKFRFGAQKLFNKEVYLFLKGKFLKKIFFLCGLEKISRKKEKNLYSLLLGEGKPKSGGWTNFERAPNCWAKNFSPIGPEIKTQT